MGIALPKWMIETQNNGYVLGVYGLLFGIFLPWFVGSWWYGSRRVTKDGALTMSADSYFKDLKEDVDFERALQILSASSEFSPKSPKGSLIKNVKNEKAFSNFQVKVFEAMKKHDISTNFVQSSLKTKKDYAGKAAILLYAHLLRVPIQDTSLLRGMSYKLRDFI
jgi:translocation protein SEC63